MSHCKFLKLSGFKINRVEMSIVPLQVLILTTHCKFLRLSSGNSITSKTYGEESLPECSLSWTSQWEKLQNPSKKQAYSEIPSFYSPQTMADRQVKVFAIFFNYKVSNSIHFTCLRFRTLNL